MSGLDKQRRAAEWRDEMRLQRIEARPGRATMDDVIWLVSEVKRLRAEIARQRTEKLIRETGWTPMVFPIPGGKNDE